MRRSKEAGSDNVAGDRPPGIIWHRYASNIVLNSHKIHSDDDLKVKVWSSSR